MYKFSTRLCLALLAAGFSLAVCGAAGASQVKPLKGAQFGELKSGTGYVPQYDATPQVQAYATIVHLTYVAAREGAESLRNAIATFLDQPTETKLKLARFAWTNGRIPYLQTEAFRFYEGPIDHGPNANGEEGPEGRINAWPLNEAHIDYVKGNPKAGFIQNAKLPVTREVIVKNDQVSDEKDVTTGWHAIEFLLWGQDLDPAGPGKRSAADFKPGTPLNDRRRQYLMIVTDLLVDDLKRLEAAWQPAQLNNYVGQFFSTSRKEAVSKILTSLATLSGFEMANERLAPGLDSGDQEDEQSCFSDTTRNDFVYDLQGIKNVYFGSFGAYEGEGLDKLLTAISPQAAGRITSLLRRADAALAGIDQPFDLTLASAKGSAARRKAEQAYEALTALADGFVQAGAALGVRVVVPTE